MTIKISVECSFPGCTNIRDRRYGDHCEVHKHEPHDCACLAGAPVHTDERCPGFKPPAEAA